jgi:hypothetical protein
MRSQGNHSEGHGRPVIGALLGHANARTTQRYAHLASDTLTDATEIVDGIVTARSGVMPPGAAQVTKASRNAGPDLVNARC